MSRSNDQPLLAREQSRRVDKILVDAGFPSVVLMENAGRGAAEGILALLAARPVATAIVIIGPGNNGGDGLVVARHLSLSGITIRVCAIADPIALSGDAAVMRDAWIALGNTIESISDSTSLDADLVVDAMFGTGLTRPLQGLALNVVRSVNKTNRAFSIALDVPSGLDADTGSPIEDRTGVFAATHTFTFGTSKPGLHTGFGLQASGIVRVVQLGAPVPPSVIADAKCFLAGFTPLSSRPIDAHKGDNGRVLVVGGSAGMTGAAVLSGRGALRGGAGLVTIASRAIDSIDPKILEMTSALLPHEIDQALAKLDDLSSRVDAMIVGPGLGHDDWARAIFERVLQRAKRVVVDADALTMLASMPSTKAVGEVVLTPHPLEMARLLGKSDAIEINNDRLAAARECARKYSATVVLKGAGSLVADADGRVAISPAGEPVLGVAGSGDVLSGAIGARLADRTAPASAFDATLQAVLAHGRAGTHLRAQHRSSRGVLASEIADVLGAMLERQD